MQNSLLFDFCMFYTAANILLQHLSPLKRNHSICLNVSIVVPFPDSRQYFFLWSWNETQPLSFWVLSTSIPYSVLQILLWYLIYFALYFKRKMCCKTIIIYKTSHVPVSVSKYLCRALLKSILISRYLFNINGPSFWFLTFPFRLAGIVCFTEQRSTG